MITEQFFDENGVPYFCVTDGRGHKIRVVDSVADGDLWIAAIRALMDRSDIMGLGEKLVSEADLIEDLEVSDDDDIEMSVIYHAYLTTIHRYRAIEAMETRSALLAEQPR